MKHALANLVAITDWNLGHSEPKIIEDRKGITIIPRIDNPATCVHFRPIGHIAINTPKVFEKLVDAQMFDAEQASLLHDLISSLCRGHS